MTGHAFQVLVDDDKLRASLTEIRQALSDGGRFAFEARSSLAQAWESWIPANAIDIVDPSGRAIRISHQVQSVVGDVVTFTETTSDPDGAPLRADGAVADLGDVLEPTVLSLIRHVVDAGHANGAWVGVCGEAGGDPTVAAALVGWRR